MTLGKNRILGDNSIPASLRPHRVAIANWPTSIKDPRTESFDVLVNHIRASGYDGLETNPTVLARFFPGASPAQIVRSARTIVEKAGLSILGSTLSIRDPDLRKLHWLQAATDHARLTQDLGSQFLNYQLILPDEYLYGGGAYRADDEYLRWCADVVAALQGMVCGLGLNFYLEFHVDCITEDPAAVCRIIEMTPCELNGDLSHLLSRGYTRGRYVETITRNMGHTHVRLSRKYGDLSADVPDPKADWEAKGITWQLFELMKPALVRGLSSRTLTGETGPMHLVTKSLDLDAALVPLWRAMARLADAAAQGIEIKVNEPADLRPWG